MLGDIKPDDPDFRLRLYDEGVLSAKDAREVEKNYGLDHWGIPYDLATGQCTMSPLLRD